MESYEKLREIGKGSYGVVWLVKNRKDKKNVSFPSYHVFFFCLKIAKFLYLFVQYTSMC